MSCHISYVSHLIIPFVSQGPKGQRGIKGAPGDRGQMGELVRGRQRGKGGEGRMCAIHHKPCHEVCVCMCVDL